MMATEDSEIYRDLIRFKPEGMTPNAWAVRAGVSRTVWTDMRRHGNPSRRTLEKLLSAAGWSLAEFEALRIGGGSAGVETAATHLSEHGGAAWTRPNLPPLPLLGTRMGGEWGDRSKKIEWTELNTRELVDRIPRPVSLARDHTAYAITILGDSMWPRFRPGRRVAVSSKAPVAVGDDVLVKLKASSVEPANSGATAVLVKEFVGRSGSEIQLRQFNPHATFSVAAADVSAIEKVLGELV